VTFSAKFLYWFLILTFAFCASTRAESSCTYPNEARALVTDWSGERTAELRAKLQRSPDDPVLLFLVGVAELSNDAPGALRDLERAIQVAPRYPWPYFVLMDVYANLYPDPTKLARSTRIYRSLCPANYDAYRYLSRLPDAAVVRELSRELRSLLESATSEPDLAHFKDLWAAEFRSSPGEYERLRAAVKHDLERIEPLTKGNVSLLQTLQTGYELTEQPEKAKKVARELLDPSEVAYEQWTQYHPRLQPGATKDERLTYRDLRRKEAEELFARWPKSSRSCSEMLETASKQEEAEEAGERMLQLASTGSDRSYPASSKSKVAGIWLRYGIRLKDVAALAEESLSELDQIEQDAGPLKTRNAASLQLGVFYDLVRWESWNTLLDVSLRLGNLDRARLLPKEMRTWLDAQPGERDGQSDPIRSFRLQWSAFVDIAEGKSAEALGHKADSLAYYQRVLIGPQRQYPGNLIVSRARALWEQQGGTDEGWLVWSKPIQSNPSPAIDASQSNSSLTEIPAGWTEIRRPLADLNLQDFTGRYWTVADLKGKVTLVNVWAQWCAPCVAELPLIQKVYGQVQQMKNIQLITLNIDDNPGLAELLMKKLHLTFPVLLGEGYFAQIQPPLSIPRTWIIDKTGTAHLEKINGPTDLDSTAWVSDVVRQLRGDIEH